MTDLPTGQAEEVFEKIQAIEAEAQGLRETAAKDRLRKLHEATKRAELLIQETERSARAEVESIMEQAVREAEAEGAEIEKAAALQVEELRRKTASLIQKARELCR